MDGDGCCGNDVETSCRDRGGDGDESCGDGQGWVQISVPVQLSNVYQKVSGNIAIYCYVL